MRTESHLSIVYGMLLAFGLSTASLSSRAQGSASLGNGLSAASIARGGTNVTGRGGALDAVEGNPAALAGLQGHTAELSAVGAIAGGSFTNATNTNAPLSGRAAAIPYGAAASSLGRSHRWAAMAAFTPEILMRANWHYNDAPGYAGVNYGYQRQETQITAVRSSLGVARSFGPKWSAGATVGIVYNANELHAPYIFQQQPQLAGTKVLLNLTTHGYGWNGGAGVQWRPSSRFQAGLAWKSGTTLRTQGDATGTASALFTTLHISADPTYSYHAQVMNHLPQSFDAGISWQMRPYLRWSFQTDFIAWGQAFQQLPVTLSQGTNATINSVAGSSTLNDAVPLRWKNQTVLRTGVELPVKESATIRAGYSYATNPVPSSTLIPLTAAIMQNSLATGAGYHHGRWFYDAAYQAQLPATQTVGESSLLMGEYNYSRVQVWTQSVTLSTGVKW